MTLINLPNELIFEIILNLPIRSIVKFSLMNKHFYSLSKDIEFWRKLAQNSGLIGHAKLFDYMLKFHPKLTSNPGKLWKDIREESGFIGCEELFIAKKCYLEAGKLNDLVLYDHLHNLETHDHNNFFFRGLAQGGHDVSDQTLESILIKINGGFNILDLRSAKLKSQLSFGMATRGEIYSCMHPYINNGEIDHTSILSGLAYSGNFYLLNNANITTYDELDAISIIGNPNIPLVLNKGGQCRFEEIMISHHIDWSPMDIVRIIYPKKNWDDLLGELADKYLPYAVSLIDYSWNKEEVLKLYSHYLYSRRMKLRTISYFDDLIEIMKSIVLDLKDINITILTFIVKQIKLMKGLTEEEKIKLVKAMPKYSTEITQETLYDLGEKEYSKLFQFLSDILTKEEFFNLLEKE